LLCFINITIINFSLNGQALVTNNSTHEKWEFVLEDTGDILQIALPAIAGLTTIILWYWFYNDSLFEENSKKRTT